MNFTKTVSTPETSKYLLNIFLNEVLNSGDKCFLLPKEHCLISKTLLLDAEDLVLPLVNDGAYLVVLCQSA